MAQSAVSDKTIHAPERILGGRRAAERSARVAQKLAALGEMTGGIVHDFRNILAVIESGLRLAERSADEPGGSRAGIAAAQQGLDRAAKLTSQVLAFARQVEPEAQTGNLNELLRCLSLFLKHGAGPGIHVGLNLASDIPECVVDRSQFGLALLNLVVNARDAMPRGGEIQISTQRCVVQTVRTSATNPGTYVRVRVKDRGQGMSPEVLQKVFDPFFTTKPTGKGTGLGLSLSYDIVVKEHGGELKVESEAGNFTEFIVKLPKPK